MAPWTLPTGHPAVAGSKDKQLELVEPSPPVEPASDPDPVKDEKPAKGSKAPQADNPDTPFHDARDAQGHFISEE